MTDPGAHQPSSAAPPVPAEPGGPAVVAGRYVLDELLGRGSSGMVFRATDQVTGVAVAVKLLAPMSTDEIVRLRREIAAMRILRLPGVVRLFDDGLHDGQRFLAMELLAGTRFPGDGVGREWEALAPRVESLLQTLAHVHAAGVIHRDLKPANILVDAAGRPTVLDFGLARGPELDDTVTLDDATIGTPRYLAPEQVRGRAADARSDLYAVGVMLFEHLTGRSPHPTENLLHLLHLRATVDAPPIQALAPHLPEHVAGLVDSLLARRREDRPRTAAEALAVLRGAPVTAMRTLTLPRLGGDAAVRVLVEAARAGRAAEVWGPPGSGRSRVLEDAVERLAGAGTRVVRLAGGVRPFESLRALSGEPPDAADPAAWLLGWLRARLAEGTVIAADDTQVIDRWTAELLARSRGDGALLRVADTADAVRLKPLEERDLRALFVGHDRLLHLPEDAARALYERAGGLPARLDDEVRAWVAAALARWDDGRIAIDRPALERLTGGLHADALGAEPDDGPLPVDPGLQSLLAWVALAGRNARIPTLAAATGIAPWEMHMLLDDLVRVGAAYTLPDGRFQAVRGAQALGEWLPDARMQASRRLATALPPGTEGRLAHLIGAGELEEAGREARTVAAGLARDGHLVRCRAVLAFGLTVVRQVDADEGPLLTDLCRAALHEASPEGLREALYELRRAHVRGAAEQRLECLLDAALRALRSDGAGALVAATELGPFEDDEDLECLRQSLRVQAAFLLGLRRGRLLLDALAPWAEGSPARRSRYLGWLGILRYRQQDFAAAARLHAERAEAEHTVSARVSAWLNAASALVEDFRPAEARELVLRARDLAAARRLSSYEARSEWLLRTIGYRTGALTSVDRALVEATAALGEERTEALILLTEAAVAWRTGHLSDATRFAEAAEERFRRHGHRDGRLLAAALGVAARGGTASEKRALARDVLPAGGRAGIQVLGLLASAAPFVPLPDPDTLPHGIPTAHRAARLEILAMDEAEAYCRASRSRVGTPEEP